ncbi:MAG: hypothetical protein RSB14_03760, partial [Kiritimatiellia bacterium]
TPTANAFVMPLSPNDTRDWEHWQVFITYDYPDTLGVRLRRVYNVRIRKFAFVDHFSSPVVLTTSHGRYLLIVKDVGYAPYLNSIRFDPLR